MIRHCFIGWTKEVWQSYVAFNKTEGQLIQIEYNFRWTNSNCEILGYKI